MDRPLVSIIVPSFQQARFLRACLDSVLTQDYEPIEVLVVDGGSTDGTVDILRSYGDRIWFRSERDGGQCSAINEGFRRSRGEILAWLNSDDFYYPGAVRRAVEALAANPGAGVLYGEGELVDESGAILWRFPETVPFDLWRLANVADYILQPTAFFRREALFQHGLLDDHLHYGLDWELWIRLGKKVPFVHVPDVLAASRIHAATKTATGGFRRLREIFGILRRHDVRRASPAAVSHAISTVVRKFRPMEAPVKTDVLLQSLPSPLRSMTRPLLAGAERRLRRWLQNAQGIWPDGFVGSIGRFWLPNEGRRCELVVRGRNLDLREQVVALRTDRTVGRTQFLAPGETFELRVPVPEGASPVKALVTCARTRRIDPLDPALGPRRAGFVLDERRLIGA
jgi:hypothetical protein